MATTKKDGSVGKGFTQRDEPAFAVYRSLVNGRMTHRDACEQQEGNSLAKLAYQLTDTFLGFRRDA